MGKNIFSPKIIEHQVTFSFAIMETLICFICEILINLTVLKLIPDFAAVCVRFYLLKYMGFW